MKKGKTSKVKVKPGDSLRLRYAIFVHDGYASVGDSAAKAADIPQRIATRALEQP